jgi:hypothetical protein
MPRFLAAALLCLVSMCVSNPAFARGCVETGTVMVPICGMSATARDMWTTSDGRRVKSIRVTMKRERRLIRAEPRRAAIAIVAVPRFGIPSPDLAYSIARPARYIAGRLICAVNVNSALAERGITGTGSAVAKSFLRWGRASAPVPGAVAVSSRRGGGHVALVSRVVRGKIYVWNPSPRGQGWQEHAYRYRAISFRVPG